VSESQKDVIKLILALQNSASEVDSANVGGEKLNANLMRIRPTDGNADINSANVNFSPTEWLNLGLGGQSRGREMVPSAQVDVGGANAGVSLIDGKIVPNFGYGTTIGDARLSGQVMPSPDGPSYSLSGGLPFLGGELSARGDLSPYDKRGILNWRKDF